MHAHGVVQQMLADLKKVNGVIEVVPYAINKIIFIGLIKLSGDLDNKHDHVHYVVSSVVNL